MKGYVHSSASGNKGRGAAATADMKARLAAGWTVEQLWARFHHPDGFTYDMGGDIEHDSSATNVRALRTASGQTVVKSVV